MVALIGGGHLGACSTDAAGSGGDTDLADLDDVEGDTPGDTDDSPIQSPTAFTAYTTLIRTLVPESHDATVSRAQCDALGKPHWCAINPALDPLNLAEYEAAGLGRFAVGPGEPLTLREDLGIRKGTSGGERRSIFTLVHMSDTHITDEESPLRNAMFDNRTAPGALRVNDLYTERVVDAFARTINAFGETRPFDAVIVTGDLTDNAQRNEFRSIIAAMTGGPVQPDSGHRDDLVPGPDNDPQDPFEAPGIAASPIYFVLGNHDACLLGIAPIVEDARRAALEGEAGSGTRDGATMKIARENVAPDADRLPLFHAETIESFFEFPLSPARKGMGLPESARTDHKAYYTFEAPNGAPIRFVVLDTAHRYGGFQGSSLSIYSEGALDRPQFDDFLLPELDRAARDGRMVVVASHHQSGQLQDDGQPERFVSTAEFRAALAAHPHVILHLVGHGHMNEVWAHKPDSGPGGYFEIEAASLVDYPQQQRFTEFVDNGDGTLSIVSVVVDHYGPAPFSDQARKMGLIDFQSGWGGDQRSSVENRNVEMIVTVPENVRATLAAFSAPTKLEHATTWTQPAQGR